MDIENQRKVLNLFNDETDQVFTDQNHINEFIPYWATYFKSIIVQAENGGLKQFFENNYHTYLKSTMYHVSDDPDLLEDFTNQTILINKVLKSQSLTNFILLLQKLLTIEIDDEEYADEECNDCFGNGSITNEHYDSEDEDCEEDEEIECSNCSGTGKDEIYSETFGYMTPNFTEKLYGYNDEFYDLKFLVLDEMILYICENELHSDIPLVCTEYKIKKNLHSF